MLKKKKDPASESSQSNDTLRILWSVKYLHLSFVFNLFRLTSDWADLYQKGLIHD